MKFKRPNSKNRCDNITVIFDDGNRVIAKNWDGSVMFDGSKWLFNKCFEHGYFIYFTTPVTVI